MSIDAKELQAGLAITQDGKRVAAPKSGNYAVRPVAGGQFIKANGQDVIRDLNRMFPGCVFLWLSKPFKAKQPDDGKEPDGGKKPDDGKKDQK
jgi:hypothetical protein